MSEPDLHYTVLPDQLTMGEKNGVRFTITNYSGAEMTFDNPNGIPADDFPAIDDPASGQALSCFYIYLNFGDRGGDLTTVKNSSLITINLVDMNTWTVKRYPHPDLVYYWKVCPKATVKLLPHDSLVLLIDTILVNECIGETPLQCNYRAQGILPQYQLPLIKLRKPVIQSFSIRGDGL